jgi:pimeloyl-ACP methyl ester carboxylesterase
MNTTDSRKELPVVYCIPGTGVDERLFLRLDLGGYPIKHIHWTLPFYGESLEAYALRLATQIDTSKPFILLGVSFGGMICAALAKHLEAERIFLISSSKHRMELPPQIRYLRLFPFYRLLPDAFFIRFAVLSRRLFGFRGKADGRLFLDMLRTAPAGYYARAAECIVHWKASTYDQRIIHLHGTADRVLPIAYVKPDYVIAGGTHNMLMTHAEEISRIIREELLIVRPE